MSIQIFDKLLSQADKQNKLVDNAEEAREWLRNKAKNVKTIDTKRIIQQGRDRGRPSIKVGQMYLYKYNALHKDTLPYWDSYPLVFPFKRVGNGFYGLNMHYLPLPLRAKLMDALYDTINNGKADETTKLKISYSILSGASKYKWFKPCVKHYLNSQVASKFIYIDPDEWDIALFLPLQRFNKATLAEVYKDSKRIIAGG